MGTGRTRSKPERRVRREEERREAAPRNAAPHVTPAARIQTLAGDPSFMTSLARGLTVIEAFSGNRHHPTTAVLSAQTGLPRAAVHRCLYTLRRLGFVDSDDERHFYLRPSVLSLGYSYLYSTPLASATQPTLERVSRLLRESCSIATLEGDSIVYVARSPVTRIMSVDLRVGSRLPAFCTSMGRVLLASVSPEKLRAYVAQLTLTRYTDRTIASKEKLLGSRRLGERAGYAFVIRSWKSDCVRSPCHSEIHRVQPWLLSMPAPTPSEFPYRRCRPGFCPLCVRRPRNCPSCLLRGRKPAALRRLRRTRTIARVFEERLLLRGNVDERTGQPCHVPEVVSFA